MYRRLIAVLLLASTAWGAEALVAARPGKKRWWLSVAALSAVAVLDMHSSWQRRELNPMLRSADGGFAARGVAVKSSIVGASCGVQWLLLERRPRLSNAVSGVNLGLAAWSAGVVTRNLKN